MAISIRLDEMSVEEKLRTMESLWDDLCSRASDFPSPAWHHDLLVKREAALESGGDQFEDWDAARRRIENDLG